jgi:spore coat polysaccharide biosynthesis predicted glycosyltransferase SpsG
MNKIIFFYDYDLSSGIGHYQRCKKFKKIFPSNSKFFYVNSKIKNFIEKNKTLFDFGVIDSYRINHELEKKIKKFCNKLITIDDLKNRKYGCDILINYSPVIKKKDYSKKIENKTKLLLGEKFNFLNEFVDIKKFKHKKNFVLFFYLGQKNRSNIIKKILSSVKDRQRIKKVFVFGNKKKYSSHDLFLKKMNISDILIISSGVTLQEGLSRKKIIFSKFFSKNQKIFFNYYKDRKLIKSISEFKTFINSSISSINESIQRQYEKNYLRKNYDLIFNLKKSIIPLFDNYQNPIIIKKYSNFYCKKVYLLQNKENRKFFKNIKTFDYATHKKYLKQFLCKEGNFLYTIFLKFIFVGFVKLELKKDKFYVSIIIDKNYRGRNIGTNVLRFLKSNKIFYKNLVAEINKKNLSSIEAFRNANFSKKDIILF